MDSIVIGSMLLVIGFGFMSFAIGIWIAGMQVHPLLKKGLGSDFVHVLIFFVIGLMLNLSSTLLTGASIPFICLPWYLIASSITLYFGVKLGKYN